MCSEAKVFLISSHSYQRTHVCNSTVPADSILHAHSPPLCPKISGPKIKSSSSLSSWAGFKDNDARKGVELDRQKLPANIGSGVARKKGAHWL